MCLECVGEKSEQRSYYREDKEHGFYNHSLNFKAHALKVCHLLHLNLLIYRVMTYSYSSIKPFLLWYVTHRRSTIEFGENTLSVRTHLAASWERIE